MLKELRIRAGLSQSQLARALGYKMKFISNIECGRCRLPPAKYGEVSRVLNISVEELIEAEVEHTRSSLRELLGLNNLSTQKF